MSGFHHLSDAAILAELGSRVAQTRLAFNLTQADLADEAGLSKRTVLRIEAGESTQVTNLIRVLRVLRLLDAFGAAVPRPTASPIEKLRTQARAHARKRASNRTRKPGTSVPLATEWTWKPDTNAARGDA